MDSLQVRARKGFFRKSLTRRLKPYMRGTSIQAYNLQLPEGRFRLEIDIADRDGEITSRS